MNESFVNFLNRAQADPNRIQQALRMHISERTGDLTQAEMLAALRAAAADGDELDRQLARLRHDPRALEELALLYFGRAWENEAQARSVEACFLHGKRQLPVVETAILAVVTMYAMYLIATDGGVVEETEIARQGPDGTWETSTVKKREPFAPIATLFSKFWGGGGK